MISWQVTPLLKQQIIFSKRISCEGPSSTKRQHPAGDSACRANTRPAPTWCVCSARCVTAAPNTTEREIARTLSQILTSAFGHKRERDAHPEQQRRVQKSAAASDLLVILWCAPLTSSHVRRWRPAAGCGALAAGRRHPKDPLAFPAQWRRTGLELDLWTNSSSTKHERPQIFPRLDFGK